MAYNTDQKPGESVEHWYRRLAKTADQRLVRLESYKYDKNFKTATKWAYNKAIKDIHKWSGSEADRFNVAPPESKEKLLSKINDIRSFLESPTSTKKGIIDVYKKRADTINERYGTNFTWQQLAKYYTSGEAEKWDSKFGSKTALKTIAVIQGNGKKLIDKIKAHDKKDVRVDDSVINKTVEKALKDEDLDLNMLFK